MTITIFDDRICHLGEGPLWHPEREQLFWFDILGKSLLSHDGVNAFHWNFPEMVSAGAWVDDRRLLIASQRALSLFDIDTQSREEIVPLEADNPLTRSNDGRADPYGGFWIGTMGLNCEPGLGAIYRLYRGELRKLVSGITISNAICFSPDGGEAYAADTATKQILRWRLDNSGWPKGDSTVFLDLNEEGLAPDGAVIDSDGMLWNAHWGSGLLCAYDRNGRRLARFETNAPHLTCPAFGGKGLATLYLTSASDLAAGDLEKYPDSGKTFQIHTGSVGQKEHRFLL